VVRVAGLAPLLLVGRPARWRGALLGAAAWCGSIVAAGALGMGALWTAAAWWPGFFDRPAEVEGAEPLWALGTGVGVAVTLGGAALARRVVGGAWGWAAASVAVTALLAGVLPAAGYLWVPGAWAVVLARRGNVVAAALAAGVAAALLAPAMAAFGPALTSRALPVLAVLPVLLLAWTPAARPER